MIICDKLEFLFLVALCKLFVHLTVLSHHAASTYLFTTVGWPPCRNVPYGTVGLWVSYSSLYGHFTSASGCPTLYCRVVQRKETTKFVWGTPSLALAHAGWLTFYGAPGACRFAHIGVALNWGTPVGGGTIPTPEWPL